MVQVQDVIDLFEQEGTWVDWQGKTRDHLLVGEELQEVKRIGVCWVASRYAVMEAIKQGIDLIITHENPFYQCSTQMNTAAFKAANDKCQLLIKHHISVYRCHDVWDRLDEYGVADQWVKRLGFTKAASNSQSFYRLMNTDGQSLEKIACRITHALSVDGENGVYVFGDPNRRVKRLVSGTGAITNLYEMLVYEPDAVIVSDDGVQTYDAAQYAVDHDLGMIVVNHAACEKAGLKAMVPWLRQRLGVKSVKYLDDGIRIRYYTNHLSSH